MMRQIGKQRKKAGLPTGTIVYSGEKRVERVRITLIDYDETHFQEKEAGAVEECFPFKEEPTMTWININGLHDVELVEELGTHFGIHPLVLEDIVSVGQRPKVEEYDGSMFIVAKMLSYDDTRNELLAEHVSLLVRDNYVISFQEREMIFLRKSVWPLHARAPNPVGVSGGMGSNGCRRPVDGALFQEKALALIPRAE